MSKEQKINCILVDTLNAIQQNDYMTETSKPDHNKWRNYGQDIYKFVVGLQKRGFEVVLILGGEGQGKSYSARNLQNCIWYNCDIKNFPTKEGRARYGSKTTPTKYHVIPHKYIDILKHVDSIKGAFADQKVAFLLGHIESEKMGRDLKQKLKVLGSLAHKQNIEGKMEVTLYTHVQEEDGEIKYYFRTRTNGLDTCRSPEGMFEGDLIPNDLNLVLEAIQSY